MFPVPNHGGRDERGHHAHQYLQFGASRSHRCSPLAELESFDCYRPQALCKQSHNNTWQPIRPAYYWHTFMPCVDGKPTRNSPLKTWPVAPSPIFESGWKSLVARLSCAKVNSFGGAMPPPPPTPLPAPSRASMFCGSKHAASALLTHPQPRTHSTCDATRCSERRTPRRSNSWVGTQDDGVFTVGRDRLRLDYDNARPVQIKPVTTGKSNTSRQLAPKQGHFQRVL